MNEIKQKKCKVCSLKFTPYKSTQVVCTPKCAIKLAFSKPVKPNYAKIKREKLESLDTKKQTYVKKVNAVKVIFQKWIRERDKNEPCISCGAVTAIGFDGGHFYKAENYSGLIFDERNCFRQCQKCNRFLQGNNLEYANRLRLKFGIEWMEQLRLDAYSTKIKKYTDEELEIIKQKYK
jgi:hypothetical protein